MRFYIATMIATGSLISTAQADQNLDKYRKCWAEASSTVIHANGVSGRTLSYAAFIADSQCRPEKAQAMATNNLPDVNWVTEQLVVKLHNANQAEETAVQDIAATEPEQN